MDRHELYEQCVQSPEDVVRLLRTMHGGEPLVLGEDFCGTAAVSREWVRSVPGGRAIALDADAPVLALARERAAREGRARIEFVLGDARTASDSIRHRCDVLFVGNFSIGELGARAELVAYLRHVRSRLAANGVLAFDLYGGASAQRTGQVERAHTLRDGRRARYVWEQASFDPRTGRVENALHFRVEDAGEIVEEHLRAFVYRWRLWSLPELADALSEAGFAPIELWNELPIEGLARPIRSDSELSESWIACVSARPR